MKTNLKMRLQVTTDVVEAQLNIETWMTMAMKMHGVDASR